MRYCAQLPEPDCKSGRVAHKVCRTTGRADPPAFKTAGFPIATRLRRPGALRPPGPPTGKVPAPGTVSRFLLRKNLETGGIIYQFIGSIGGTRRRVLPGRDPTAKPLAVGDSHGSGTLPPRSAQLPVPD